VVTISKNTEPEEKLVWLLEINKVILYCFRIYDSRKKCCP
jgi:hypothetical protein